jgi:acyl dehydratase
MPTRSTDLETLKTLLGQEVGVSDWLEVTQEMIGAFADVTRDRQWIHLDTERARTESPFGTTVAHGFLTLSLLSQLHSQAVRLEGDFRMIINYGLNRVRFPAPVRAGARIRAHCTLQELVEIDNAAQLTWLISVEIEGGAKPALVAEWLVRVYLP